METINRITDRMKRAGVDPRPATPPDYTCKVCSDVGYVRANVGLDHPLFGRLLPCPACGQFKTGAGVDEYGLLPIDRGLSWKDVLDIDLSINRAKKAVQDLLDRGYGWVYLWGGFGTAKTHILKIAVAESLRAGLDATYTRMADMLDEIRQAYDQNKPQEESTKRLRRWAALPVLAIDEIEKTNESDFVIERRFQILDNRYEMATRQHHGITLIAGNVAPEMLDGAIGSRVKDGRFQVVHITARDMRPFAKRLENA